MTGFAALGCNPEDKGTSLSDLGGAALGTVAYSPDGTMYIAIRAAGSLSANQACHMEGNFDIDQAEGGSNVGLPIVFPQQAFADNEYGWAAIAGECNALTDGGVSAGHNLAISGTTAGTVDSNTNTDAFGPAVAIAADSGTVGRIWIWFPTKIGA